MDYEFWFWITILFVTHWIAIIVGYKAGMANGYTSGIHWSRMELKEIQAMNDVVRKKNADA